MLVHLPCCRNFAIDSGMLIMHSGSELLQGKIEAQMLYWKHQLSGNLPVLALPTDRPRPAVQTPSGSSQTFSLLEARRRSVLLGSHRRGATLLTILWQLSRFCYIAILSRWPLLFIEYRQSHLFRYRQSHRVSVNRLNYCCAQIALEIEVSAACHTKEGVREVALGAYTHQKVLHSRRIVIHLKWPNPVV